MKVRAGARGRTQHNRGRPLPGSGAGREGQGRPSRPVLPPDQCGEGPERRAGHCPHSADLRHVGRTPRDPSQQRPAPGSRARRAPPPAGPASRARGGRAGQRGGPSPPSPGRSGQTPGAGLRGSGRRGRGRAGSRRGEGPGRGGEGRGAALGPAAGQPGSGRDKGVRRRGLPAPPPGRRDPARPPFPPAAITGPGSSPAEPLATSSSLQAGPHLPVGGERASDPGPGSNALRRRRQPRPPRAAPPPLPRADTDGTPWAAAAAARERAPQRPPRFPPGRRRRRFARPRARRALPLNTTHCGGRHEEARPRAPAARRGRGFPRARRRRGSCAAG